MASSQPLTRLCLIVATTHPKDTGGTLKTRRKEVSLLGYIGCSVSGLPKKYMHQCVDGDISCETKYLCELTEKAKPKSKKKEEPSSLFQRQRVDTLLLDLRSKFPPTFYQVQ